jgi:hypothetical protein
LLTATRITEHPKLPQGWELASLGNHAADTGGCALRGWPRQTLPTSLSSSMATIMAVPLSCLFFSTRSSKDMRISRSALVSESSAFRRHCHGIRRLENRFAAGLIRFLYGLKITDLGPFRAGRADLLRRLALEETTYGWAVEIILKGTLSGFRVVEVPVTYYPRIGKSKIGGTLKGTLSAPWFILSLMIQYYFRPPKPGIPRST